MPLSTYKVLRVPVPLPGGQDMTVRGLGTADFAELMQVHLPAMQYVFGAWQAGAIDSIPLASSEEMILRLVSQAPALVAHVIALAADEPDQVEAAAALPMPTSITALNIISQLTFGDQGGPKNFLAALAAMRDNLGGMPTMQTATAQAPGDVPPNPNHTE